MNYILYAIWIVAAVIGIPLIYMRGKKVLSQFPSTESVKILYRNKTGSASTVSSKRTKMRGIRRIMDIVVTEDELWIKTPVLFASLVAPYGLIQRIELKNISNVSKNEKDILIDFTSGDTLPQQIILNTKKPEEFIQLINPAK